MRFIQDYKALPAPGSISIRQALAAGKKDISNPARAILIAASLTGILIPAFGFSLWLLPICVLAGMLCSFIYTWLVMPKWRIWAYAGVYDIHQFQRAAELDRLLPRQSSWKKVGIMSRAQRATLSRLQQRFDEDPPFMDDPDVGSVSNVYEREILLYCEHKVPMISISDKGIETRQYGFYPWSDISHEAVATKSLVRSSRRLGGERSAGTREAFFFVCPDGHIEIPLSELDITASELDRMLCIHRGRYMQKGA